MLFPHDYTLLPVYSRSPYLLFVEWCQSLWCLCVCSHKMISFLLPYIPPFGPSWFLSLSCSSGGVLSEELLAVISEMYVLYIRDICIQTNDADTDPTFVVYTLCIERHWNSTSRKRTTKSMTIDTGACTRYILIVNLVWVRLHYTACS